MAEQSVMESPAVEKRGRGRPKKVLSPTPPVEFDEDAFGNPDTWKPIYSAENGIGGHESTYAMKAGNGLVVRERFAWKNPDGSMSFTVSLLHLPAARISGPLGKLRIERG